MPAVEAGLEPRYTSPVTAPEPIPQPTTEYEHLFAAQGYRVVAGVDEVGRGSWAGPVVASAVILPLNRPQLLGKLSAVRDSKQLTSRQRSRAALLIFDVAVAVAVGCAPHHLVDSFGLTAANRQAMQRAIRSLCIRPDGLLIDYFTLPECPLPQLSLCKGDALSLSIAAASIVAKVTRDSWMEGYEGRFPGYSFAYNKGYGTAMHRLALVERGPSPIHRRSFCPVASCLR